MNLGIIYGILMAGILFSGCSKAIYDRPSQGCPGSISVNPEHPLGAGLQAIVDKYVAQGIPGVQVVVRDQSGWGHISGGYAKIESQQTFLPCGAGWLFSITKTYTAVLIMKQKERNRIDPDQAISSYLPSNTLDWITGGDRITVRMLLNHTSGIPNLTDFPEFMVGQFNHPLEQPSVRKRLQMLEGKPLAFDPGTDFQYSNSNYLVLQQVLEAVSGKSYAELLHEDILDPLGLSNTYYEPSESALASLGMPDYYFDRYANSQLENISAWNDALARASDGYGGIAATPADVIDFYDALVHGRLLQESSLNEMKTWIKGKESAEFEYGEGFEYWQFNPGSAPQFGHEGDGIGCSTQILYIPDHNRFIYININAGRQLFGPYLFKITDMKNELCRYAAQ